MKYLLTALVFVFSSLAMAEDYPLICNGDKLAFRNGYTVYDFNWASQCEDALHELTTGKTGLFCDGYAMVQIRMGVLVHHSFADHCQEALVEAKTHKGLFCHNEHMLNQWGQEVGVYMFRSDCQAALLNMK